MVTNKMAIVAPRLPVRSLSAPAETFRRPGIGPTEFKLGAYFHLVWDTSVNRKR